MKKLWIVVLIVFIAAAILLSFFMLPGSMIQKESITMISEETFSADEMRNLSGGTYNFDYAYYTIRYMYGGTDETCFVQKMVYQDTDTTEKAYAYRLTEIGNISRNEEDIEIDGFSGSTFEMFNVDTGALEEYSVVLKNEKSLIFGNCNDKDILTKVVGWFIERY